MQTEPVDNLTREETGPRVNLLGKPEAALARFFDGLGEKPFRARQVMQGVGE